MKIAELQQIKIENSDEQIKALRARVDNIEDKASFHTKDPLVNPSNEQQMDFLQTVCRKLGEFNDDEPIEYAYEFDYTKMNSFIKMNKELNYDEKMNYISEALRNLILYKCPEAKELQSRKVLSEEDMEEFSKACLSSKTSINVDFSKGNFCSGSFIHYSKDRSRLSVYGPALINSVDNKSIFTTILDTNKKSSTRVLEVVSNKIYSILREAGEYNIPIRNELDAFPKYSQR